MEVSTHSHVIRLFLCVCTDDNSSATGCLNISMLRVRWFARQMNWMLLDLKTHTLILFGLYSVEKPEIGPKVAVFPKQWFERFANMQPCQNSVLYAASQIFCQNVGDARKSMENIPPYKCRHRSTWMHGMWNVRVFISTEDSSDEAFCYV